MNALKSLLVTLALVAVGQAEAPATQPVDDTWLREHPQYDAAGDFRVMGYNSPSVPADQRYAEMRLPVRRR